MSEGREIINYEIIQLLMLSSQSRELKSFFLRNLLSQQYFFCEIYCLRNNTFFRKISLRFPLFSLNIFSPKNAKYGKNVCEIRTKIFAFSFAFLRESFRSLHWKPYLIPMLIGKCTLHAKWNMKVSLFISEIYISQSNQKILKISVLTKRYNF